MDKLSFIYASGQTNAVYFAGTLQKKQLKFFALIYMRSYIEKVGRHIQRCLYPRQNCFT